MDVVFNGVLGGVRAFVDAGVGLVDLVSSIPHSSESNPSVPPSAQDCSVDSRRGQMANGVTDPNHPLGVPEIKCRHPPVKKLSGSVFRVVTSGEIDRESHSVHDTFQLPCSKSSPVRLGAMVEKDRVIDLSGIE